jgi:2-oxo-4-hydroxy-4-carboxy--5-ureidoimidazoline (OHCU) decarboxylase
MLKLLDRLDIDLLDNVIQLLCAYKNDIHSMREIYELLRGLQVGFRAPTEADENAVLQQYPPLADNLARRFLHLDA